MGKDKLSLYGRSVVTGTKAAFSLRKNCDGI